MNGSISAAKTASFRSALERQRMRVDDGMQVLMRGRVSLYEARGEFQLIVRQEVLKDVDGSNQLA